MHIVHVVKVDLVAASVVVATLVATDAEYADSLFSHVVRFHDRNIYTLQRARKRFVSPAKHNPGRSRQKS